jgi:hypothetical protein
MASTTPRVQEVLRVLQVSPGDTHDVLFVTSLLPPVRAFSERLKLLVEKVRRADADGAAEARRLGVVEVGGLDAGVLAAAEVARSSLPLSSSDDLSSWCACHWLLPGCACMLLAVVVCVCMLAIAFSCLCVHACYWL